MCKHDLMLLAKLDIKNKLVFTFQEGMNKKNIKKNNKNEVKKKQVQRKLFFYITSSDTDNDHDASSTCL